MDLAMIYCPTFYFSKYEKVFPCKFDDIDNNINDKLNHKCPIYFKHNELEKYITYVLFYQHDYGIHDVGAHKYDVEFVRVFYGEKKYFLSQHGRDQGLYTDKLQTLNGRPIVYVAKNTHAHYPNKGIWLRGFCFANDVTRKDIVFDPSNNIIQISNVEDFQNKLGLGKMQWNAYPNDIIGAPKNCYFWYRFFLPLSKRIRFGK